MKKLLLTLFALGTLFLTGCFQLPAEYRFSAHNVGGGFIIFEPFDICGGTPFPLHPSTCQSFDADMSMPASRPHADTLSLNCGIGNLSRVIKKVIPVLPVNNL